MVVALPANKKWMSTKDVAKMLGLSMGRVRQLGIQGPKKGGLTRYWAAETALVFDEEEVSRFAKAKPRNKKTGRPRGGFKAN
jgi:hypothetical protein